MFIVNHLVDGTLTLYEASEVRYCGAFADAGPARVDMVKAAGDRASLYRGTVEVMTPQGRAVSKFELDLAAPQPPAVPDQPVA